MDSFIVPDLTQIRRWLDQQSITWFECDACQSLHLPHMQNFEGIFDAKLDLIDNVILFSALAEVRPSALIALSSEISQINASSLTVKAFLDIQDEGAPRLVVCQSINTAVGLTYSQFLHFMKQSEEQLSMIITEVCASEMLMAHSEEKHQGWQWSTPVFH